MAAYNMQLALDSPRTSRPYLQALGAGNVILVDSLFFLLEKIASKSGNLSNYNVFSRERSKSIDRDSTL